MSDTPHTCPNCGAFPVTRPGALERELAAALADAERYRWLRSHRGPEIDPVYEYGNNDALDAAIDAARKQT